MIDSSLGQEFLYPPPSPDLSVASQRPYWWYQRLHPLVRTEFLVFQRALMYRLSVETLRE